jgi:PII-like signaling protein
MKGFLVVFFTQQNSRYQGKMLGDWVVDLARDLGLRGATLIAGIEGFGHTGKLHSAHFFEMADEPIEVQLAVTDDECDRLFKRLETEAISLFYTKIPLEIGLVGGGQHQP